ncbi:MAG: NADH-quinone oxidoreductase subunit NuoK [Acidobacteriota bacterium]
MKPSDLASVWNVGTEHYLALSLMLFGIGLFGVINRRNLITILMSIELMLNAVNLNLVAFSYQRGDLLGQVFTMFTITVAAGEAAVGLGILLAMFRLRQTTRVDAAQELEG